MPTDLLAEQRTCTVRAFLKLNAASLILLGMLIPSIYLFRLTPLSSYLLASIPVAPLCAILIGALRKRAIETDPNIRRTYVVALIWAGLWVELTRLLVSLSLSTKDSLEFAILFSALPLSLGIMFAGLLLMPKRTISESNLGDLLHPIRSKLATPRVRLCFRYVALYFIYIALSTASRNLFNGHRFIGVLAYAVALLPVLPLFGLVPIYKRYMTEQQDEFQRHLFRQSILVAFFGTVVIVSVMGRLQDHALISKRIFRAYPIFFIFWWLQLQAFSVINAIQSRRIRAQEKQELHDQ